MAKLETVSSCSLQELAYYQGERIFPEEVLDREAERYVALFGLKDATTERYGLSIPATVYDRGIREDEPGTRLLRLYLDNPERNSYPIVANVQLTPNGYLKPGARYQWRRNFLARGFLLERG